VPRLTTILRFAGALDRDVMDLVAAFDMADLLRRSEFPAQLGRGHVDLRFG